MSVAKMRLLKKKKKPLKIRMIPINEKNERVTRWFGLV